MADTNFRANRSREDAELTAGDLGDNPLADLARLIGQREQRVDDFDRGADHNGVVQTLDHQSAAEEQGWAEDEQYAGQPQPYAEENYVQPRLPDYPADRDYAQYDDARAPAPAQHYAEPADGYADPRGYEQANGQVHDQAYEPRYADDDEQAYDDQYGDDPHDETRSQTRYAEEVEPPRAVARQFPGPAPQARDQRDEEWDEQSDLSEDYEDDTPTRRNGLAIVLALLGLILIGAAGAYAYRAMFGGAMLVPSLPPVIKPASGPSKIVPPAPSTAANPAGAANPAAPAQLVPREEQPVPVQPPPAPPKVLSTIPVAPAPAAPAPSAPPAAPPAPSMVGPAPQPAAPAPAPVAPKAAAPSQGTEPKKVHTVPIRPDQMGDAPAAAPTPVVPPAGSAPAPRSRTETAPKAAPPRGPNAPLSLVPGSQSSAPAIEPPRTHVAHTEPPPSAPVATAPSAAAPAPSAAPSTGGYAVQVSSQRSEAEAQASFRELQAKYPAQLGSRQPIIHRADLGNKGTYYRAMVGPFGSAEAAASLCSSIKAAGGHCIVQRN